MKKILLCVIPLFLFLGAKAQVTISVGSTTLIGLPIYIGPTGHVMTDSYIKSYGQQ